MSVPKCQPITTKAEFSKATAMLQQTLLGLTMTSIMGRDESPLVKTGREIANELREAIKAAPFVTNACDESVDATPESKAAENALIDQVFASVDEVAEIMGGILRPEPAKAKPADDGGILVDTPQGRIRFVPTPAAEPTMESYPAGVGVN